MKMPGINRKLFVYISHGDNMNKKIIDKVTITGIDDFTLLSDLKYYIDKYSQKFPPQYSWLEWGILISESRAGTPRFPSYYRINDFLKLNLKFSAHICGRLMRDICVGNWRVLNYFDFSKFNRIQLNLSREIDRIDKDKFINGLKTIKFSGRIIMQSRDINHPLIIESVKVCDILPLFDVSGGRGIKPSEWPVNFNLNGCGFAGGLNPENIEKEIEKISLHAPGFVWIDVETGVRSENKLDFEKVDKFLKIVEPWVK